MALLVLCKEDYKTKNDVMAVVDYITCKDDCAKYGVNNIDVYPYDASYIADQMMCTKIIFNQINGRQFYHLVLSLQPSKIGALFQDSNLPESMIQSDELDRLMAPIMCSEYLCGFQLIYGIHQKWSNNTVERHVHILINSVSLNGEKIDLRKPYLYEILAMFQYYSSGLLKKPFSFDTSLVIK